MRTSMITAALLAALGAAALTTPASAAPIGPGFSVAAPADGVTTVQMEHRMMHRHMRHRMERRMMRRHMRHRMMHRM